MSSRSFFTVVRWRSGTGVGMCRVAEVIRFIACVEGRAIATVARWRSRTSNVGSYAESLRGNTFVCFACVVFCGIVFVFV